MSALGALAGVVAFLSCVTLVPIVKIFSAHYQLFDSPGPLKIHTCPISRLGGVAIAISLSLGVMLCGQNDSVESITFFAALLLIWTTGLADDLWGLSPAPRLAAQIAAGSMLWFGASRIPKPGSGIGSLVGTCLIIVFFANAFNFCDGSDGVSAGVASMVAATYILQSGGSQGSLSIPVAWALVGACLGFLLFNFPPAGIFMGDSGSNLLGFVVGFLALDLYRAKETAPLAFAAAFLPAALPLVDAALAILRRLRSHSSPLYGDRRHFYDLLLARGWTSRTVALACYGITGIFCFAGWLATRCTYAWGVTISAMSVGGFLVLEWRLGALQIPKPGHFMREATALRLPNLSRNTK